MEHRLTGQWQTACLETLKEWVAIPSVLDESATDTPFGRDIQHCLETALATCRSLGFRTYLDEQGYYGYAETGEGEELLAILCHLDVVPAGNPAEWRFGPFNATVEDGQLYGRGTQDDKGPSVAALYAVKALVDQGVAFNKRVRLIFGTDEETLWRCMMRYSQQEEVATFGFAPDSEFPLTYAEKGLLQCYLEGPGSDSLSLNCGGALNVVPDKAVYAGKQIQEVGKKLQVLGYAYEESEDSIAVLGQSIHAKDAPEGQNAITRLVEALAQVEQHPALDFLASVIGQDAHATKIFGEVSDEASGALTFNVAQLEITPTKSRIGLDLRLPVTTDKDYLVAQLEATLEPFGLQYQEHDYLASLYVPLESSLVQTLLDVYRQATEDMTEPFSSGGATFARTMPNCVAFGAIFEGDPVTAHQVDERISLDSLYNAMEIYAEAVLALTTSK